MAENFTSRFSQIQLSIEDLSNASSEKMTLNGVLENTHLNRDLLRELLDRGPELHPTKGAYEVSRLLTLLGTRKEIIIPNSDLSLNEAFEQR